MASGPRCVCECDSVRCDNMGCDSVRWDSMGCDNVDGDDVQ